MPSSVFWTLKFQLPQVTQFPVNLVASTHPIKSRRLLSAFRDQYQYKRDDRTILKRDTNKRHLLDEPAGS